jgi:hypothetical protein
MALTTDQLDQLEYRKAEQVISLKSEMVRVAKDILIENSRNSPVSEREITSNNVIQFASDLINFIIE